MTPAHGNTRVWRRASEILPLAIAYRNHLLVVKDLILNAAWKDIRETYSHGVFVNLFNPRLVEWFKQNRIIRLTSTDQITKALSFILPEHAWKLEYAWSCHNGELDYVESIIVQCEGVMDPKTGTVIVTLNDLETFRKVTKNDQKS